MSNEIVLVGDVHIDSTNPSKRTDNYKESIFDKLRQVDEIAQDRSGDVLCVGDLFHRFGVPNSFVGEVLEFFDDAESQFWTVFGNHDFRYSNYDSIKQTPMYLLIKSGVIKDLTTDHARDYFLNNYDIEVNAYHFQYDLDVEPPQTDNPSLLVAHQYIDNVYDEKREVMDLEQCVAYDLVVAGHEHIRREKTLESGTKVLVPGSIGRVSMRQENMDRDVYVYEIEKHGITLNYNDIELDVKSVDEIYDWDEYDDNVRKGELDNFVESMKNENRGAVNPSEYLERMDLDSDIETTCEEYLREFELIT